DDLSPVLTESHPLSSHAPTTPGHPLRTVARDAVAAAWDRAIASGALPALSEGERPPVEIERPANPEHGDLATSIALKLARPYRRAPLQIAEAIAAELRGVGSAFRAVDVAAPGFINLWLSDDVLESVVEGVLADPDAWGRVPAAHPQRIDVEFVS